MDARILLPELPSLDRVPLPVSLPYSSGERATIPRFYAPSPSVVYDVLPEVYGSTVYATPCDVYPSTIPPIFGDISGTEIEAALCDPPEVYAPTVYAGTNIATSLGDPAPTPISFHVGRLEHDEGDTGELAFDVEGGLPPNARLEERFFETREDADLGINPLSQADSPGDVVLRTSAALWQQGRHSGSISFRSHDVSQRTTIYGRVDVVYSPQVYGNPVYPNVYPIPVPEPTVYGTDVPGVYPDVYPSVTPPMFGKKPGTPIDPEVCPPIPETPEPIPQVYGGEIAPVMCDVYPTAPP